MIVQGVLRHPVVYRLNTLRLGCAVQIILPSSIFPGTLFLYCKVQWIKLMFSFQAGDFSISLTSIGRNKHFRIHHESGVYTIGQRKFSSLQHLVDHYQRAPIYTSQKGEKLYLIRPLPK